jgi:hypothetical protein
MLPTLFGRIQTRIVLVAIIGGIITALIAPILPIDGSIGDKYRASFIVLASVIVLGIGWEIVYHLVMQFRWEKDWPTLFGLVTLVPEGLLLFALLKLGAVPGIDGPVSSVAFWLHFVLVWLAVWLVANGPMRVPFIRWRFRGGRFV